MIKGRRIGTFTTGIVLVIFGIVFLLRLIYPNINYVIIASMWPIVLVILGIEIILSCFVNKDEKIIYDFAGIFILITLSIFAMAMGCMEYIITHIEQFKTII
jgi:uncharacterized membrane protein HdeD (DUF308 family)